MSTDTEHTRDSSAEQVEITPELLAAIERAGSVLLDNTRDPRLLTADALAYHAATNVWTVLALVRRIRELESEIESATWWCGCGDGVKQGDRTVVCDTCGMDP